MGLTWELARSAAAGVSQAYRSRMHCNKPGDSVDIKVQQALIYVTSLRLKPRVLIYYVSFVLR
jgi:hypothetical protein